MGKICVFGSIVISFLIVPSLIHGQSFEPLDHTSSYKIINGQVYFDPTTTPAPTFLQRWLPFLAQSNLILNSDNSEEEDEAIINSVSGPSEDTQSYGGSISGGGVLNLPSFSQNQNSGYSSYQNPGPNQNQNQGSYQNQGTYQNQNQQNQQNPGYPSYPNQNAGYPSYQNQGQNQMQSQSPYLTNEEDNYLSSGSVNVPQQVNPQLVGSAEDQKLSISSGTNNAQPSTLGLASDSQQPPSPVFNNNAQQSAPISDINSQKPEAVTINYFQSPPTGGPYTLPANSYYNNIPNKQQYYSGVPYHPQPYVPPPTPTQPYVYPTPPQVPRTTTERPFYQGFLDFFGFGTTESPFAMAFAGSPFNLPQQFAQARKSNIEDTNFEDDDEEESSEENEEPVTPETDKPKDFPCPKMGIWQWNGEVCIAVGPAPAWACKPNDLAQSGRLTICRNKIFFPFGINQYEKK